MAVDESSDLMLLQKSSLDNEPSKDDPKPKKKKAPLIADTHQDTDWDALNIKHASTNSYMMDEAEEKKDNEMRRKMFSYEQA